MAAPGSRWWMLAVIGVTLALTYGVWYSYSVFLVALLHDFGWSRSVLAGAFSVFTLVHGVANPLLGALCDRVGPRRLVIGGGVALAVTLGITSTIETPTGLYVAFGVFTAVAVASCGWIPSVMLVQRHFSDRLGLAIGIVSAGVGIGMVTVVPLCQYLIDAVGWRNAYQVLGAICVAWIVPANLLWVRDARAAPASVSPAPGPVRTSAPGAARADLTLREALRTLPFWLLFGASFFGNINAQTLHVHQVAFMVDQGMAAMLAATVVGMVGASSIVGKIGGGWLSDRIEREIVFVSGIAIMVLSVAAIGYMAIAPSMLIAYGYAILLGVGYSATASLLPAMMNDRFKGRSFGAIFGVGMFGGALGGALGPWFAGRLFDATGSYKLPFIIVAVCGVIGGAAAWHARTLRRRTVAESLPLAAANGGA